MRYVSKLRFFAALRMTRREGLRMTRREGLRMTLKERAVILREPFANVILREPFANVILKEPFAFCHPEGVKRPKDLAQDKLRDRRIWFLGSETEYTDRPSTPSLHIFGF